MLPFRFQSEEVIECRDTIYRAGGKLQRSGDVDKKVILKKAKNSLRSMEHFDKCIAAGMMFCDGAVQQLKSIITAWVPVLWWWCRR